MINKTDQKNIVTGKKISSLSRRQFVLGASSALALTTLPVTERLLAKVTPKKKQSRQLELLDGNDFNLSIDYQKVNFTGRRRVATTINQGIPAPVLCFKEGERVRLNVTNNLEVDSSIHWHGLILPTEMDGVPGLSFDGIKPGETFHYEFTLKQSGTYWYHSHSGFQEQTGMYGAIVIEPKEPDPFTYDRDYVVMLSDWSDEIPEKIYAKLKKMSHYYNFNERTAGTLLSDIKKKGIKQTWQDRSMWNQMRMSDRDISDVTGYTYTFLMNGNTPDTGWLGEFNPGEKIRLRFINSGAMTIFDVRIPGLKMTVVAADGQNIKPVVVDEFRIGVAETYDVIVEPDNKAYTLFAQSIDRTGFAVGTLTSNDNLRADIPAMDPAPVLGHRDMGMGMDHSMHNMSGSESAPVDHSQHNMSTPKEIDHSKHNMSSPKVMDHSKHDMSKMQGMDHSQHDMSKMQGMDHSQHNMSDKNGMDYQKDHDLMATTSVLGLAGFGSKNEIKHLQSEFGPHVDMRSEMPQSGLSDPGIGLRQHQEKFGRKVLNYSDIKGLVPTRDKRQPSREIQLHLTGNMSRYMWSVNGIKFADADPIQLEYGERVRIVLVNDTMMSHPIHLHGVWSELETGDPDFIPRKHTIIVQPGSSISYLVTADAIGRWAYHCHLLFHMPGMMREVRISSKGEQA
jgi:CopA family copper-resistance protein